MPARKMDMPGMKMDMPGMNMNMPGKKMDMPGKNMDMPGKKMDMPGMNMNMPGMKMDMPRPLKDIAPDRVGKWLASPLEPGVNSITLPEMERLALEHNPTLIQARAHVDASDGQALQAGLFPNPGLGYNGDLMGLRGPGNGAGEFQGAFLEQEIILGGKLKWSRNKYKARSEAARKEVAVQTFKVSNDVKTFYFRMFADYQTLYIEKEMLKSAQDQYLTVQEMFNLGQANRADLHAANVSLQKQKLKVMEAQNELDCSWRKLTAIVGIEMPIKAPAGNFELDANELSWEVALKRLLENSPQIAQARAKLRSDEVTVKREKRQKVPDLLLSAAYGWDALERGWASRATASVVNIPLFDRNQGTVKQAEADLSRQKAELKLVELRLRKALAEEYKKYSTECQYVESYKNVILPESEKRYIVMLNSYRNTRADWNQVLESQRDFFSQRLDYIKHLQAMREAEISINGFVLTGALESPIGVDPPGHIDAVPKPR